MWKTNNLGTFPAEIPVRVLPTRRWKLQGRPQQGPPGLVIATLRMYRPICKQSNLDSPGNIIFLRYLPSRQFTSSLPTPILAVYVIRADATAFVFMRRVIVVIKIRNMFRVINVRNLIYFHTLIIITDKFASHF